MLGIKAVITRTAKHLEAVYDERLLHTKVDKIQGFRRSFKFRFPEVFGKAEYTAIKRTFDKRRPQESPMLLVML